MGHTNVFVAVRPKLQHHFREAMASSIVRPFALFLVKIGCYTSKPIIGIHVVHATKRSVNWDVNVGKRKQIVFILPYHAITTVMVVCLAHCFWVGELCSQIQPINVDFERGGCCGSPLLQCPSFLCPNRHCCYTRFNGFFGNGCYTVRTK
ncbi:MAG: hypothetical protein CM15mP83_9380 [Flavobacteriaceae bacterium]|nr:MAG: hypothetical protein CM15mP83_9380 [Flavobacteriaceae bacterium]